MDLSCKFDQFLTVLGKSYEECSYPGTLNMANELSKPNQSAISSLLLLKMVKNWSNLHEKGVHYLVVTLYINNSIMLTHTHAK